MRLFDLRVGRGLFILGLGIGDYAALCYDVLHAEANPLGCFSRIRLDLAKNKICDNSSTSIRGGGGFLFELV